MVETITKEESRKIKNQYARGYYAHNKERILASKRGKRNEYMKRYYKENKQSLLQKQKVYSELNKDAIREYKKIYGKEYARLNKHKSAERQRQYRKNFPEKSKNVEFKYLYGITVEDYKIMFNDQNGCCAICKRHQSELKRKLHVDHCHITNKVRGLLCQRCNTVLGHADDSLGILNNAIKYLSWPRPYRGIS